MIGKKEIDIDKGAHGKEVRERVREWKVQVMEPPLQISEY